MMSHLNVYCSYGSHKKRKFKEKKDQYYREAAAHPVGDMEFHQPMEEFELPGESGGNCSIVLPLPKLKVSSHNIWYRLKLTLKVYRALTSNAAAIM